MKKDETYYFGVRVGKDMKRMKRRELYARMCDAYQLAGSMLIGADIKEENYGNADPPRNINGWTDEEVSLAVETLLNFLSRPCDVHKADFDKARAIWRDRPAPTVSL
jgi:hypothetical protein